MCRHAANGSPFQVEGGTEAGYCYYIKERLFVPASVALYTVRRIK